MNLTLPPGIEPGLLRTAVRRMARRTLWVVRLLGVIPLVGVLVILVEGGSLEFYVPAIFFGLFMLLGAPELTVRSTAATLARTYRSVTAFHLTSQGFGLRLSGGDQFFYWPAITRVDRHEGFLIVVVTRQLQYVVPTAGLPPDQQVTLQAILDGSDAAESPYVPGPHVATSPGPGALVFTASVEEGQLAAAIRKLSGPRLWVLRGAGIFFGFLAVPGMVVNPGPSLACFVLPAVVLGFVLPWYVVHLAARRNHELIGDEATYHFDSQRFVRHSANQVARWNWWTVTAVDELPDQFVARITFLRQSIAPVPTTELTPEQIAQLRWILTTRGGNAVPPQQRHPYPVHPPV